VTEHGSVVDQVADTGGTGAVPPGLRVVVTEPDIIGREVAGAIDIVLARGCIAISRMGRVYAAISRANNVVVGYGAVAIADREQVDSRSGIDSGIGVIRTLDTCVDPEACLRCHDRPGSRGPTGWISRCSTRVCGTRRPFPGGITDTVVGVCDRQCRTEEHRSCRCGDHRTCQTGVPQEC